MVGLIVATCVLAVVLILTSTYVPPPAKALLAVVAILLYAFGVIWLFGVPVPGRLP